MTINLAAGRHPAVISRETARQDHARWRYSVWAAGPAGSLPRAGRSASTARRRPDVSWTTWRGSWLRAQARGQPSDARRAPYHELVVRRCVRRALHPHGVRPGRLAAPSAGWWLLGRMRPAALFTTGGYLARARARRRARRIPTLVWEGNVLPGRAPSAIGRLHSGSRQSSLRPSSHSRESCLGHAIDRSMGSIATPPARLRLADEDALLASAVRRQ